MSEWIPVERCLPEYGFPVLIYGVDERPIVAFRYIKPDSNQWVWCEYPSMLDWYVGATHWMKIPEPPQ